ncbi:MAG: hypothetical protein O6826_01470 [Acidobacteria bacterium]|nr:hypothetical protein [Acidobacteriota bacterium]
MNFYRLRETPPPIQDVFFRESRLSKGLFFLICLVLTAILAFVGYQGGIHVDDFEFPSFLAYWIAGVIAILALVALSGLRASLKDTNWLMRYDGARLFIKYRSYLNDHLPEEDPVVVEIGISEIKWVRAFREKRLIPGSKGRNRTVQSWTYLDIRLNHEDTEKLRENLQQERQRWPETTGVSKSRRGHYPVRLVEKDLIRIDWRSHQTSITPNVKKSLEILGEEIEIQGQMEDRKVSDFTALEGLDEEQQKQMIRELVEGGHRISAVKVVQKLYGSSTTEADEYIRALLGE